MKRRYLSVLIALACGTGINGVSAAPAAITQQQLKPVPIQQVTIDDPFWSPKFATWRSVTIPDCLAKFERDGVLGNFDHIARGELNAPHGGAPWFDGLTYEMIRAIADFLAEKPDPALKAKMDEYIRHIAAAAAKDPDGYLNTYAQMKEPTHRWGQNGGNDRWQHDLYNAGCLVDAAVHYYRATGESTLLATAVRISNGMCKVMGPAPRKNLIPGHAVGEEALVDLYELFKAEPALKSRLGAPVNEAEYLALAQFWIDARGHHEGRVNFGDYDQDGIPVLQQQTLEGHAVRATLMGAGLTAVGMAENNPAYLDAAERLWKNYTTRRMYVTGGVGSFADDEKFGPDYVLPNKCYAETCAAVGSAFFSQEINRATGVSSSIDEVERSLYNGALAGVSLAGNGYLYENPLESSFDRKCWDWHSCPCCPPMFLKLMGALPSYVYASDSGSGVYVNLFIGSKANMRVGDTAVEITQKTHYPWAGDVRLDVSPAEPTAFDLYVRVPAWCTGGSTNDGLYTTPAQKDAPFKLRVNGQAVALEVVRGYAHINRQWKAGDSVEVEMAVPIQRLTADPRVEADRNRVTLTRGPIVYCLESTDNAGFVRDAYLPDDSAVVAESRADLLGGVTVLKASGRRLTIGAGEEPATLTAIPYYANANRGSAAMEVWIPKSAADAVRPTIANRATVTASHRNPSDSFAAVNSGLTPVSSGDPGQSRFSWWNHRGTSEWIQYNFDTPRTVSGVEVYWWDDQKNRGGCRVPQSWRLLYQADDGSWKSVPGNPDYGVKTDTFNTTTFHPVTTRAIRMEAQLQPNFSAGVLQWRVQPTTTHE